MIRLAQAILSHLHLQMRDVVRFRGVGFQIKRVYDKPAKADGRRVLVDRVWPRGLTKEEAQIDDWLKEIAPSTRLRKCFEHDPARWTEFKKRYVAELKGQRERVEQLAQQTRKRTVTLLFGAKDIEHNNAVALTEYIEKLA
jgi:uncharacterized protein YeaO (DUF488 family)